MCLVQMDTMANQNPSHHASVPEGPTKEDAGLNAAFWQERYEAEITINWASLFQHALCVACIM